MPKMQKLPNPHEAEIAFQGPPPEAGPLPAFFYFALSGEESLELAPYNTPATLLTNSSIRVFSITLPGHGPGFNKHHAMQYWADEIAKESPLLHDFFERTLHIMEWLIENGWIDEERIAVGGLSRGGWIATQLAARDKRIKIILGFSPLTRLSELKEFALSERSSRVKIFAEALDLEQLTDSLTHVQHIRFYIGNRDERVNTDACYHFIRKLADKAHAIRARHMQVELRLFHSTGHMGHGTPPPIFEEGVDWLRGLLL